MLKKLAITGGISSGKTQALKIFKKLGSYTVNTDKIAHKLLDTKNIKNKIIKIFGKEIQKKDKIDRKRLAKIVFENENRLYQLEKILHPQILDEIKTEYEKIKNKDYLFFVVEIPLLFEIKAEKFFDVIITVSAKDSIAKKRYKYKDYVQRKKRQMSLKEKAKLSDYVIRNNLDLSNLEKNIKKISKLINKY
ncbi:MAG: dephospho-CoA kinase [Parachlamydiales bacterium]|jgi:dephospho-CoA kinase